MSLGCKFLPFVNSRCPLPRFCASNVYDASRIGGVWGAGLSDAPVGANNEGVAVSVLKRRMRALKALIVLMMIFTLLPAVPVTAVGSTTPAAPKFASFKSGPDGPLAKPSVRDPQRLNVKWSPGIPKAQIDAAASRLGFRIYGTSKRTGWTSIGPTKTSVGLGSLAQDVRETHLAARVAEEQVYSAAADPIMPSDIGFASQWSLNNTGQTGGTPDADIDAPEAWAALGTGSSSITVAVVDTGVMRNHPDLVDNMWLNAGEIPGNGRDDDGNGYADDRYGYDFYNYDGSVYDVEDGDQHGTHVAGIIGASANNGLGVSGVNWDVTIMPVKFLGPWGGGDFEGAEAIVYAVDNGADVINCSWGGGGDSEVLGDALDYAAEHGVLVVCAAGNWGEDQDAAGESRNFPSSYDSTAVVAVAATDHNDELADFSNFGAQFVDIAAPGVDVLATLPYEPTGFYINELPHKIVYLPFVLEALEPVAARDQMIVKSVQKLGASLSTKILVVDDSMAVSNSETPGDRSSAYTNALAEAGYADVTVWNTEDSGVPSAAAMGGRLVIWFTGRTAAGWDEEECVNAAERAAISSYLAAGGRLLMASGELATDMEFWGFDYEWFESTFHCWLFDLMTWGSDIKGKAGGPFAGIEASIPNVYQDWDSEFAPTGSDAVMALDPMAVPLASVGGYGNLSGTSMAAPTVSGAAALLMSALPGTSAEEIRARLENTGDHLTSLEGKCVYESRINVANAFAAYPGRPIIETPVPAAKFHAGDEVPVTWRQPLGADANATYEVEYGLPYTLWSEDFEGASLGSMESLGDTPWFATDVPAEVYSGVWGARSGDVAPGLEEDGWIIGNETSLTKTITIPDGGGEVGFWWWWDADDWDTTVVFEVDDRIVDWPWEKFGWTYREVALSAGEHTLEWTFVRFLETDVGLDGMGVDDITVTAYDYSPVATNDAGDLDAVWTVPAADTHDAQVRVRAQLDGNYSAWAYAKPLSISTDFVAPAPPLDFNITDDGDGGVTGSWINPIDIDFDRTVILASSEGHPTGPSDPSASVVYEGTDSTFEDGLYADGTTVYYAAYSVDLAENWSAASTAQAVVTDNTAPNPVAMLAAEMSDGVPAISWLSPDSNIESIKVLRRTDDFPSGVSDSDATVVFDGIGAHCYDFELAEEGFTGDAYYSVWATDASGNVSEVAEVSLYVDASIPEGEFYLNGDEMWTASSVVIADAWIGGASEMRLFANGEYDEEAPWVPFDDSSAVQLLDIEGIQSVLAQFRAPNGAVAEFYDDIYVNLNPPAAPTGLTAQPAGSKVSLSWDEPNMWPEEMGMRMAEDGGEEPPFDEDVPIWAYNVYIAEAEDGPYEIYPWDVFGPTLIGGLEPDMTYWFKVSAIDYTGLEGELSYAVSATPGEAATRISGANRYDTSAAVSASQWDESDTVVIASGQGFADALGASALAGYYDAPVLLVPRDGAQAEILSEIGRLSATNAVIIGGEAAVSSSWEALLENNGVGTSRISGGNRYETAQLCALELASLMDGEVAQAFVVSGESYADALAIAPIAFANKIPVLLTADDTLPAPTAAALGMLEPFEIYVVGGTAVISEDVEAELDAPEIVRIAGRNRFATAVEVMDWATGYGFAQLTHVGVASSASFADGLSGGAAIGRQNGVMLFSAPTLLPEETFFGLADHANDIGAVGVFGGKAALSDNVLNQIEVAISGL